MRLAELAASVLFLAGCQALPANPANQAAPFVGPSAPTEAEPKAELRAVTSLAGEWRVAGIDGRSFDQPVGLALSASEDEIWWAPRCAGFARSYAIDGSRLAIGPSRDVGTRTAADRPPPCAIGLPRGLRELFQALDAGQQVGRTAANGVEISGGGHSLLLFSQ